MIFMEGKYEIFRVLSDTDIKILTNEIVECSGIQIIGVDYSLKVDHLEKILKKTRYQQKKAINPFIPHTQRTEGFKSIRN